MNTGLLIIRVLVGTVMFAHGAQKLFGWFGGSGIRATGEGFATLGYRPGALMAAFAGIGEAGGGVLLALGLAMPLAVAAIVGVMTNAILSVHIRKGFFNQNGGFEFPLTLGGTAIGLGIAGPGRFSMDSLIGWHLSGLAWGLAGAIAGVVVASLVYASKARPARMERPEPVPAGKDLPKAP
jgi:putative oxidoreductase